MASTSVAPSLLSECHISASQEEILACLREGWDRSGHYSLDETPSQNINFGFDFNPTRPLSPCNDESESSESVEEELGFTQEPVEFMSPPSSDGEKNDGVAKEDSHVAASESDRSQSPSHSQDWHGLEERPDLGQSAEFLTQPPAGGVDLGYTESQDVEDDLMDQDTEEFQVLPMLSTIPENSVVEVEAIPAVLVESCMQPFTQALDTQAFESVDELQEPVQQMELAEESSDIVHNLAAPDEERVSTEVPEAMQQVLGRDDLVEDAPVVNIDESELPGEQTPQEREGEELRPGDFGLPVDDTSHVRSTEHQQEPGNGCSADIPPVEVHEDPSASEKAQPSAECGTEQTPSNSEQVQTGNGDTSNVSESLTQKRTAVECAEDLHGQRKRHSVETSPVRSRSFPKTVMDVVRSRTRPFTDSRRDDDFSILSLVMRAGERAQRTKVAGKRSEGRVISEETDPMQRGRGQDESVEASPVVNNIESELRGEQTPQERELEELRPGEYGLPADDARHVRSTDHEQRSVNRYSRDIPPVEVHEDSSSSEKAQPPVECGTDQMPSNSEQVQRGNGDTSNLSEASTQKRPGDCAEDLHGQRKRQRRGESRSIPKTIMDIGRSGTRPFTDSQSDDDCSILSILMRAGVSFPPFVNNKRSK